MQDEIIAIKNFDEEKTEYITEKQPIETTDDKGETVIIEQDIRTEVKTAVKKTYARMTRTVAVEAEGRHEIIRKEYEVTADGECDEAAMLAEVAKVSTLSDVEGVEEEAGGE